MARTWESSGPRFQAAETQSSVNEISGDALGELRGNRQPGTWVGQTRFLCPSFELDRNDMQEYKHRGPILQTAFR
jgi:hypothetical protein